jgi:DNA-binding NarL/FixJ family response regulator
MSRIAVRLFVHHPVAAAQYSRLLRAQSDFQLTLNEEAFEIGVFDSDLKSLEPILTVSRRQCPCMRPLLLSCDHDSSQCLRLLFRGVWGLVPYNRYEKDLVRAVRQIAEGRLWFPGPVIVQWMRQDSINHVSYCRLELTEREQEVLDFVLRQLSNKEIATILRVSASTVKFHVSNIFSKLQVNSRHELSTKCMRTA